MLEKAAATPLPPSVMRPPISRTPRPSSRTLATAPLTFPSGPRRARVPRTIPPPRSRATCPTRTVRRATFSPSDAMLAIRFRAAGQFFFRYLQASAMPDRIQRTQIQRPRSRGRGFRNQARMASSPGGVSSGGSKMLRGAGM